MITTKYKLNIIVYDGSLENTLYQIIFMNPQQGMIQENKNVLMADIQSDDLSIFGNTRIFNIDESSEAAAAYALIFAEFTDDPTFSYCAVLEDNVIQTGIVDIKDTLNRLARLLLARSKGPEISTFAEPDVDYIAQSVIARHEQKYKKEPTPYQYKSQVKDFLFKTISASHIEMKFITANRYENSAHEYETSSDSTLQRFGSNGALIIVETPKQNHTFAIVDGGSDKDTKSWIGYSLGDYSLTVLKSMNINPTWHEYHMETHPKDILYVKSTEAWEHFMATMVIFRQMSNWDVVISIPGDPDVWEDVDSPVGRYQIYLVEYEIQGDYSVPPMEYDEFLKEITETEANINVVHTRAMPSKEAKEIPVTPDTETTKVPISDASTPTVSILPTEMSLDPPDPYWCEMVIAHAKLDEDQVSQFDSCLYGADPKYLAGMKDMFLLLYSKDSKVMMEYIFKKERK